MTHVNFEPFVALIVTTLIAMHATTAQSNAPRAFDRVLLPETTSETSASVSIGDLDGNGTLDVVLAKGRHWPLNNLILRNDGKGAFPKCEALGTQSATIIVAADLDGDGKIDLFVPHRDGGQNLIFWNTGAGNFTGAGTSVGPARSQIRAAVAAELVSALQRVSILAKTLEQARVAGDRGALGLACLSPLEIPVPMTTTS